MTCTYSASASCVICFEITGLVKIRSTPTMSVVMSKWAWERERARDREDALKRCVSLGFHVFNPRPCLRTRCCYHMFSWDGMGETKACLSWRCWDEETLTHSSGWWCVWVHCGVCVRVCEVSPKVPSVTSFFAPYSPNVFPYALTILITTQTS